MVLFMNMYVLVYECMSLCMFESATLRCSRVYTHLIVHCM